MQAGHREPYAALARFESRSEQDATLARGTRSNVYLDLSGSADRLPKHFVTELFARCRPIVAAPSEARAAEVLDTYARRLQAIDLATPASRPDDIPHLLDALIAREHAEQSQGGELLALDLRRQVKRLHALLTNGVRARAAARALGLKSVASLIEAHDRVGVHLSDADEAFSEAHITRDLPNPPGALPR